MLDPKLKATLAGIAKDPKRHIVGSILWEAERKKTLYLQKRRKVRFRGKTIVLRDLIDPGADVNAMAPEDPNGLQNTPS